MGVELIPWRVVISLCLLTVLAGCGSTSEPIHTVSGGGSGGGQAGSGSSGFSPVGSGGVGGSAGTATGAAGSGGAGGGASGPALNIAPHASHIGCEDDFNYVVLADHSTYTWDYAGHVTRDTISMSESMSAAGSGACFIRLDSTVTCAALGGGVSGNEPSGTFTAVRVGQLSISYPQACAANSAGHLSCWGGDYDAMPPLAQAPTFTVADFDLGSDQGCAVLPDGSARCWGAPMQATPPAGTGFASIYTNVFDTCALTKTHDIVCTRSTDVSAPDTAQLAIGPNFACGIHTDGRPFCFGYRNGNPVADPPAGAHLVEVAVGASQACGVLVDGGVTCWGLTPASDAKQLPPPDPIKVF